MLREADDIFVKEIKAAGLYRQLWQSFAVLLPVRSVGRHGRRPHLPERDRPARGRLGRRHDRRLGAAAARPAGPRSRAASSTRSGASTAWSTTSPASRRPPSSGNSSDRVRPSPSPHRVQPARRRLPRRRAGRRRPRKLGMKALAVTDHGNMFGAVAFHDAARREGHQADPGLRDLRRHRAAASTSAGTGIDGGVQPPDAAGHGRGRLPQPREARVRRLHGGLLPPAAHRQGAPGQAQPGAHRPLRLPLRRDRRPPAQRAGGRGPAVGRRASPRSSGKDRFYLEIMDHGIEEQRRVNQGLFRIHAQTGLPLVATNDAHYLTTGRPPGARRAALHRLAARRSHDTDRLRFDTERVLREERRRDGARSSPTIRRRCANTVRIAEMCDVRAEAGATRCPRSTCRPGFTIESYFEKVTRDGFARALPDARAAGRGGPPALPAVRLRERAGQGDRRHPARRLRRLLPDRLGLHPLRAREGHPGRARAADRPRAAWSPTACASPTSTPSSTTSSSSAS